MRKLSLVTAVVAIVLSLFAITPTASAIPGDPCDPTDPTCEPEPLPDPVPDITASPASLNFGNLPVNQASQGQNITVSNDGAPLSTLTIQSATLTGTNSSDFMINYNASTCDPFPRGLAPGASCTLTVHFWPQASGARAATLSIASNDPDEPAATVALNGTALTPPAPSLSPSGHAYGQVVVGETSAGHTFTVGNTGQTSYVASVAIFGSTADFVRTGGTCAWQTISVPANSSCTIIVAFAPQSAGPRSATLQLSSNYGNRSATLSGTGLAPASPSLTPGSHAYGEVAVGTTSAGHTFTLGNSGQTSYNATGSLTGANAAEFIRTGGTCPWPSVTVPANSTCTIVVAFGPTAAGERSATLSLVSGQGNRTAALSGIGLTPAAPSLSPAGNNFGSVTVNATSAGHTFTLSNSGQTSYDASGSFTGTNTADFARTGGTCSWPSVTVPANSTCTIVVAFAPTATGSRSATLTVGAESAALSGTGIAAPDITRPTVAITRLVVRHQQRKATAFFTGRDNLTPVAGLRYLCKIDGSTRRACASPKAFRRLKPGRHAVRVFAVDRAGNVSTPAVKRFQVRR